jgi:uncharacterized protein (DUF1330 family)
MPSETKAISKITILIDENINQYFKTWSKECNYNGRTFLRHMQKRQEMKGKRPQKRRIVNDDPTIISGMLFYIVMLSLREI